MKTSRHDVLSHLRHTGQHRGLVQPLCDHLQARLAPWGPLLAALALLLALSACSSSPPRPPQPDESTRRAANDPQAIELQRCRSDLQNNSLLLKESSEAAQRAAGHAARLAALNALQSKAQESVLKAAASAQQVEAARNPVYTVRFPLGSAAVPLSRTQVEALAQAAANAPLIVLRGRTDGARDSLADNRLARERAEAVRTLLVQEGVSAARIRTTWQGSGDHAVDNDGAAGRDLNRRVEIEIYRAAPSDTTLPSQLTAAVSSQRTGEQPSMQQDPAATVDP
jgi:outer membrane protein OmpA-like peptidoglycan-associated protein